MMVLPPRQKLVASPPSLTTRISYPYKYKPSGSPSVFVFITLSRADLKSAIWTLILRSRRAISPASEQMALMSAPDRSSFWLMNSSSSTSSFKDIFDVWRVKIFFLVFSVYKLTVLTTVKARAEGPTIWIFKKNFPVDSSWANESRIQRVDLVGGQNDFDISSVVKTIQLVEQL